MNLRDDDWEPLLHKDTKNYSESEIPIPNMNEVVSRFSRSRKGGRDNIAQDYFFMSILSGTIRRGPLSNNRKNRLDPIKTNAKRQIIS